MIFKHKKSWWSDPATYPLIIIVSTGLLLPIISGIHHIHSNPDVLINKKSREIPVYKRHNDDKIDHWIGHRYHLANLKKNPINQSDYFEADEKKPRI